ncbi:MAG: DUF411 domain-containing protein [Propioniciclava sp.]
MPIPRRSLILALPALGILVGCSASAPAEPSAASSPTTGREGGSSAATARLAGLSLVVAKSPTCGCCTGWIEQAEAAGATVEVEHPASLDATFAEADLGLELQACHLTRVADALFVGHIPLRFLAEYLADPPSGIRGLAVPGMPIGTPGMESGDALDPYDVLALHADGSTSVYFSVRTLADQEA